MKLLIGSGILAFVLAVGFGGAACAQSSEGSGRDAVRGSIMTVNGPISPSDMGFTLTHEHVMSRFGEEPRRVGEYDSGEVTAQVVPYLNKIRGLGCRTVVDCTAAYFGRNVVLLREIASEANLNIVTNTGWYGAAKDRYIPDLAHTLSAQEIAALWVSEWTNGIDGTDVRPGFIKLAVDSGELSEIDAKLVRAGAIAHLETGLVIAVHTGNNVSAARAQLAILRDLGVDASAWIWTHAQNVQDPEPLIEAARTGAWISLDGVKADGEKQDHLEHLLRALRQAGCGHRVLLSHDGNSYPSGRAIRPYHALMADFIPRLRATGFSEDGIRAMTVENPAEAFAVRVRAASHTD